MEDLTYETNSSKIKKRCYRRLIGQIFALLGELWDKSLAAKV